MKHLNTRFLLLALVVLAVLSSCRKDKTNPATSTPTAQRKGIYILNQGNFGTPNSTLTYYNYTTKTSVPDQFSAVNGRVLGDVGNDVEIYGSKMYIVVNVSSTLEVVNAQTGKSIQQISFMNSGQAREPRYVVFNKGLAFVSSYDGTVAVIDTASLTVKQYINVGRNPEHLAIANNKLYVANSGGLSYPNYDKTVSVIDLNTLTVTKTITVPVNPNSVVADAYGNVYVQSAGDYTSANPNSLSIINSSTDQVVSSAAFDGSSLFIQGDNLYCITSDNKIKVVNTRTQAISQSNFISDGTVIKTPYYISVDGTTGEVFVADAKDYASSGTVTAFDKNGKKEYSLTAGISPGSIAYLY